MLNWLIKQIFKLRQAVNTPKNNNIEIKNILIVSLQGIGNSILVTPLVNEITEKNPGVNVYFLVKHDAFKLFNASYSNLKIIKYKKGIITFLKTVCYVKKLQIDVCINSFPTYTIQETLLAFFTGARIKVMHSNTDLHKKEKERDYDFLYTDLVLCDNSKHDVYKNLDLLMPLKLKLNILNEIKPKFLIELSKEEKDKALGSLIEKGYDKKKLTIGFHPGSDTNYLKKRWPWANFALLGNKLLNNNRKAQIIIFGGKAEKELADKISDQMTNKPIIMTGECDIRETAAMMSYCDMFVSNDTALMHIAAVSCIPVFAIFGPSDSGRTAPFGTGHTVIQNRTDCSPCYNPEECKNNICINSIKVDDMYKIIKDSKLLEKTKPIL